MDGRNVLDGRDRYVGDDAVNDEVSDGATRAETPSNLLVNVKLPLVNGRIACPLDDVHRVDLVAFVIPYNHFISECRLKSMHPMSVDHSWVSWFRVLGAGIREETELKDFCDHFVLDLIGFSPGGGCDFRIVVWCVWILVVHLVVGSVVFGADRHGGGISVRGATWITRVKMAKT